MTTPSKYSGRKLIKPDMKKEGNFTQIPNAFILNPDIRDPELRLLLFIMMNKENRTITTKNCILYLEKTKPSINAAFEKLISLGILRITDETIEVIIPDGMKKYTLGYHQGKENLTPEVKNTLPLELFNPIPSGKENLTVEVKKSLPSGKENLTKEVKNSFKKPLEDIDNVIVTDPIILNNSRVPPVPATSGSTGAHSNNNTKGKTGVGLDLECGRLQSLASPSVLAPSLHTPKVNVEREDKESSLPIEDDFLDILSTEVTLPIEDNYSDILPTEVTLPIEDDTSKPIVESKPLPIEPDKRFASQLNDYNSSKYFLPENLVKVKSLYICYAKQYPDKYMSIKVFEMVLVYLMNATLQLVKMKGINKCLIYWDDIKHNFIYLPQIIEEMNDNPDEALRILKQSELEC